MEGSREGKEREKERERENIFLPVRLKLVGTQTWPRYLELSEENTVFVLGKPLASQL